MNSTHSFQSSNSRTEVLFPAQNRYTVHLSAPQPVFTEPDETNQQKICTLIKQLRESGLYFGPAELMLQWEEKFADLDLDAKIEEARQENAIALCLFLLEVIRPAMVSTFNGEMQKKIKILSFEDALKEILKLNLAAGVQVDPFIEQMKVFQEEEVLLKQKLSMIQKCFDEQIEELLCAANEVNERDIIHQYEILKKCMLRVNSNRQLMTSQVHAKIDGLTGQIDTILKELQTKALKVQSLGKRMEQEERVFRVLLNDCQQIFKEV